jgi:hypothetical protein
MLGTSLRATGSTALCTLLLAACVAGCGSSPPSPGEIAQNYIAAIAEGSYSSACAMLDGAARTSLRRSTGSSGRCPILLARCLPTHATVLRRDQVQLFYANVEPTIMGSRAVVKTSGTAVANRIKTLTFTKTRDGWTLSSYGRVRCPRSRR